MGKVSIKTGTILMTTNEKIKAAMKRIKELKLLIKYWSKDAIQP